MRRLVGVPPFGPGMIHMVIVALHTVAQMCQTPE